MLRKSYMDLTRQGKSKRRKLLLSHQAPPDVYHETNNQFLLENSADEIIEVQPQISSKKDLQMADLDDPHSYKSMEWSSFDLEPDSDSSSDDNWYNKLDECELLKKKLRDWNTSFSIKANALTALLGILRSHDCFSSLPSDARTLLNTPSCVSVVPVEPGFYSHICLVNNLQRILENVKEDVSDVKLLVNVDGLPLFKSSKNQLWPILGMVANVPSIIKIVFPIGIYCGQSKPKSSSSYLREFVEEIKKLMMEGFYVNQKLLTVSIKGFICDAPAKSFILNVKGHTGYYSCTKCIQPGVWVHNRMTFPECNAVERTNESFLRQDDEDFHTGETILSTIPGLDFIRCFPLDYMHLVCLGVVRSLIYLWNFGPVPIILPAPVINNISENLNTLKNNMPVEFNRNPRPLSDVKRWKATEFRQFLLYTGPVVLKMAFSEEYQHVYDHFLNLSVSMSILLSPKFYKNSDYLNYAKQLLHHFVMTTRNLYGHQYLTHNMHGLVHIADSIKDFGPLDSSGAFPFENYLQQLKKMIHKGDKPLQQIVKRLSEIAASNSPLSPEIVDFPHFSHPHFNGPILSVSNNKFNQYSCIKFSNFKITNKHPNCYCYMKCGSVVVIENIVHKKTSCSSQF